MISPYNESLTDYLRRQTIEVKIGDVPMGAHHPIRVQSMTTIDTMDTAGSIEQVIRMVASGCEYVRITAPSVKEAQNLEQIKLGLKQRGIYVPLVADIHFTPNAAELAARIVEKVRINPGNYADKKRFETIDYTDSTYQEELDRIRERFVPLVRICKEYGTAMRIGTNHGSLSDRIMSRYGDSPVGMVASALEFLKICEDEAYYNVVLSMKSSNTQVMIQAYRLLVKRLKEEGMKPYPLHLGVTEAGDGLDGRVKSALGIGTLLEDGLGDTVRVSLTEDPEFEAPVARQLIERYTAKTDAQPFKAIEKYPIDAFQYVKRQTTTVENIGGLNVPRVLANMADMEEVKIEDLKAIGHYYLPALDKWSMTDLGADYIYVGNRPLKFMPPNGLKQIVNASVWSEMADRHNALPYFKIKEFLTSNLKHTSINFVEIDDLENIEIEDSSVVFLLKTKQERTMVALRTQMFDMINKGIKNPVIFGLEYAQSGEKDVLYAATDLGGNLSDGFGDGILLKMGDDFKISNQVAFSTLQAARTRMSKTEYISCPSCGRTLFDLQETTATIRKQTDHLKGIKIGIMGCIVNGPGEMADADYGYVGIGKDKISLYRGQTVVKKSVHSDSAVSELIDLIKEDGRWLEPSNELMD